MAITVRVGGLLWYLIPRGWVDGILAFTGIPLILLSIALPLVSRVMLGEWSYLESSSILLGVGASIIAIAAFIRSRIPIPVLDEYARFSARLVQMGEDVPELKRFFERELERVREIDAIRLRLLDEKSKLEPLVSAHREVVDGLFSEFNEISARHAWKERTIGFVMGLVSSFVAAQSDTVWKRTCRPPPRAAPWRACIGRAHA